MILTVHPALIFLPVIPMNLLIRAGITQTGIQTTPTITKIQGKMTDRTPMISVQRNREGKCTMSLQKKTTRA